MADYREVREREVERDMAGRAGFSEAQVDAELPVLFTDAEWEVMLTDPAFGYVCRNGHRQRDADHRYGSCLTCEALVEDDRYEDDEPSEPVDDRPIHTVIDETYIPF
jgi:hypothetical protein